jgi:hypothetical protein
LDFRQVGCLCRTRSSSLRPDRIEEFSQSGAALGQLLAFDLILRAQVGRVIIERDGPSAAGLAVGLFESQASEGVMRDAEAVRSPGGRPVFDATMAGWYAPGILQQFFGDGLADNSSWVRSCAIPAPSPNRRLSKKYRRSCLSRVAVRLIPERREGWRLPSRPSPCGLVNGFRRLKQAPGQASNWERLTNAMYADVPA